jgi:UDP-N-acetylglucosamine--N-acetylmuramyl-(pentapeptide) pyrophosphoryl-undecaprenol N-acetylglucosamine transferase
VTAPHYAVVAGGGTGGHVLPALAVARALAARGHDEASIDFVGSRRGQEGALLAEEHFPLTLLPGRGLLRSSSPRAVVQNLGALVAVVGACATALRLVRRWRPRVVVTVGGYASFPAGLAAIVWRRPLVVVTVDAVPGLANRLLGRFAAANAVAFGDTALPRTAVTGVPVRRQITAVQRDGAARFAARHELGLPAHRAVVAVFGGSLGARRINEAAAALSERWRDREDLVLYHVTGRRDFDRFAAPADATAGHRSDGPAGAGGPDPFAGRLVHRVVAFEDRMDLVYGAADVCLCRAGAMTVAELAVAGVPAVLVPLPGAPGDHQTANARALVAAGAAELVPDGECDADRLEAVLDTLLADPARLEAMGSRARALGHPDAADRVAEVVDAHAR